VRSAGWLGARGAGKAVQLLARLHAHVRARRSDFHRKQPHDLFERYGLIAVEELNVRGLARSRLARQVNDAGWSSFVEKLVYKAESAGRVCEGRPTGASQRCACGAAGRSGISLSKA
jgi:putative transposase